MQIAVPIVYKRAGEAPDSSAYQKILRSMDVLGFSIFSISEFSILIFLVNLLLGEFF